MEAAFLSEEQTELQLVKLTLTKVASGPSFFITR